MADGSEGDAEGRGRERKGGERGERRGEGREGGEGCGKRAGRGWVEEGGERWEEVMKEKRKRKKAEGARMRGEGRRGGGGLMRGREEEERWGRRRGVTTRGRQLACKSWVHVCSPPKRHIGSGCKQHTNYTRQQWADTQWGGELDSPKQPNNGQLRAGVKGHPATEVPNNRSLPSAPLTPSTRLHLCRLRPAAAIRWSSLKALNKTGIVAIARIEEINERSR
ncbi:MAG: hypothetical protein ACKESB_00245 [Candidatus Hodgkinia cicadicola]